VKHWGVKGALFQGETKSVLHFSSWLSGDCPEIAPRSPPPKHSCRECSICPKLTCEQSVLSAFDSTFVGKSQLPSKLSDLGSSLSFFVQLCCYHGRAAAEQKFVWL
jgi:hypothetical protein